MLDISCAVTNVSFNLMCRVSSVGPLRVEFNIPVSLEQVKKDNPDLQPGGRFRPKDCEALQKVAIIIPFRKRDEHLKYWLYYLHPILQRQQLDYGVFIINQVKCDVTGMRSGHMSDAEFLHRTSLAKMRRIQNIK